MSGYVISSTGKDRNAPIRQRWIKIGGGEFERDLATGCGKIK
ncbi:hypothetical protein CAter282_2899 [Collimonas arenae]|uniref:Uncharacterized protein n=1 Tax=Collimonas arenae TaxID=279058 RepID=A0A127QKR7_9BURK|nr:hypothetical protein CAter282_2899 [Collimonas arenae]